MLNLKIFSPVTLTGTKDRLDRQLARKEARHDREARRIMRQIAFLAGQLHEHRLARAAVSTARMELSLDIRALGKEIAAGMLAEDTREEEPAVEDQQPVTMGELLKFAEARETANA